MTCMRIQVRIVALFSLGISKQPGKSYSVLCAALARKTFAWLLISSTTRKGKSARIVFEIFLIGMGGCW